jgi:glycosyltransferase involved in cell wall biosynthesis
VEKILDNKDSAIKVVHLSTSLAGGAGIAARRLHQALLKFGFKSHLISLAAEKASVGRNEAQIRRPIILRRLGQVNSFLNLIVKGKTYFSLCSISAIKFKELLNYGEPSNTVFHVHNWFNLINLRVVKKLLESGYQVVFTLHDQRIFTGGCHYSLSCNNFKVNCKNCPELPLIINSIPYQNFKRWSKVFQKYRNQITFIAPSLWIKHLASVSSMGRNLSVIHIPNFHGKGENSNLSDNKTSDTNSSRQLTIGVASMDRYSYLKGGKILKLIEELVIQRNIAVNFAYLTDYTNNDLPQSKFWEKLDYLLVPSILDNSPNVIHEAKLSGIPVIATAVGGIGELLNPEYDFSIPLNNSTHLLIVELFEVLLQKNIKLSRKRIVSDYNNSFMDPISKLCKIYSNLALS